MSIDETSIIDFISTEEGTDQVTLTISDHLDWSMETEHLLVLQSKMNTYLKFIESGELEQEFPSASGKEVVIEVVGKYPLSEGASLFMGRAEKVITSAGFRLTFRQFNGEQWVDA